MISRPGRLSRALPAMLRTGWKDALAYRSEMLVWMMTMTLPLIMLALFRAVAADGAVAGFDAHAFTVYFLATLVVRQLAGSWAAWELTMQIRNGTLGMRLLRPIHPLIGFLCDAVAALPLRAAISVPFCLVALYAIEGGGTPLARDPLSILVFLVSLALAFTLTFSISAMVGALAFFFESAVGLWQVFLGVFALASGYLIPLPLFPSRLRAWLELTPFPYMLSVPVEILIGQRRFPGVLHALGVQAAYAVVLVSLLLFTWRRGVRRYAAFGG